LATDTDGSVPFAHIRNKATLIILRTSYTLSLFLVNTPNPISDPYKFPKNHAGHYTLFSLFGNIGTRNRNHQTIRTKSPQQRSTAAQLASNNLHLPQPKSAMCCSHKKNWLCPKCGREVVSTTHESLHCPDFNPRNLDHRIQGHCGDYETRVFTPTGNRKCDKCAGAKMAMRR
jgi:hypothetical protein